MPKRNMFALTLIVFACVALVITAYQLWVVEKTAVTDAGNGNERVELRAPATGIDAVDRLNRQEAIERAIEDFRTKAVSGRDELVIMGNDLLIRLDNKIAKLETEIATLADDAQSEWTETKSKVDDARRTVAREIKMLETPSEQEWWKAREIAANALENLATEIRRAADMVSQKQTAS